MQQKSASDESPLQGTTGPGVRLFSALTGESIEEIQTDPKASFRGFGKLGGELKQLFADYFSADENVREVAKQRMEELRETLRQHGLNTDPESSGDEPESKLSPPKDQDSRVTKVAGKKRSDSEPDPGEVFRKRLQGILEGMVSRLEDLQEEVLQDNKKKKKPANKKGKQ